MSWQIIGSYLCTDIERDRLLLRYTAVIEDSKMFSPPFANMLSMLLALLIGPSILSAPDKTRMAALERSYAMAKDDARESEANVGFTYKDIDDVPANDSFVNPGTVFNRSWGGLDGSS